MNGPSWRVPFWILGLMTVGSLVALVAFHDAPPMVFASLSGLFVAALVTCLWIATRLRQAEARSQDDTDTSRRIAELMAEAKGLSQRMEAVQQDIIVALGQATTEERRAPGGPEDARPAVSR